MVIGRLGLVEIRVYRVADDGRERLALTTTASVKGLALLFSQIDLRSSCSHIQHNIQHAAAMLARLPFIRTTLAPNCLGN